MHFSYDTYAEYHSRTYRKLFANKIMYSTSLIILKAQLPAICFTIKVAPSIIRLSAPHALCEITCKLRAIHIIVRVG